MDCLRILLSAFLLYVFMIPVADFTKAEQYVDAQADEESFYNYNTNEAGSSNISDRFEKVNRAVFTFNKGVDKVILTPIDKVYRIIPENARVGISNILYNIKEPVHAINALIQGESEQCGIIIKRFFVNSTVGLLGVKDVAGEAGLQRKQYRFGGFLKQHGVPVGEYLVIPIIGSSSTREFFGFIVDQGLNPINYATNSDAKVQLSVAEVINMKDIYADDILALEEKAIDEYAMMRTLFAQVYNN